VGRLQPHAPVERGGDLRLPGRAPARHDAYDNVRVDDQSLLTKINGGRAVTTIHIIHAPTDFPLDVVVHELTHVAQYEKVGAKYLPRPATPRRPRATTTSAPVTSTRT
jgi:hypothetical protein